MFCSISLTSSDYSLLTSYLLCPDGVDCVKQTPLHYSITNTRWGVMESLVKAGADVNARRMKDGWTPVFLAGIFGLSYKAEFFTLIGWILIII